ncbi:MAG: hypothetical protein QOE77_3250 [Blastocatellia bacterium]|nr:hypothetical protein [Blastocatellia bacterium]
MLRLRSYSRFTPALSALLFGSMFLVSSGVTNAAAQHEFGLKQYEQFHDALHPLQHEALPNNDFKSMRAGSRLLVKRGNAIVALGIPRGTPKNERKEFAAELGKFRTALRQFHAHALKGTDDQLKTSFSALHDSFEMLAGMLRVRG